MPRVPKPYPHKGWFRTNAGGKHGHPLCPIAEGMTKARRLLAIYLGQQAEAQATGKSKKPVGSGIRSKGVHDPEDSRLAGEVHDEFLDVVKSEAEPATYDHSAVPFDEGSPVPKALDATGIDEIVAAFEMATKRALAAGFRVIEIHAAHGYLLHEFLSPLSNRRTDSYGESLENRMRLTIRVTEAVRQLVPADLPVFVRISATDWAEGGWDVEQSVVLAGRLKDLGVDLIDCSSGGLVPKARIPVGKGYQVPLARKVRDEARVMTGAVGLITEARQANEIVTGGDADLVYLARELLREPYWAIKAHQELGAEAYWPISYGYAVKRRAK